jgi:hypothetical protein
MLGAFCECVFQQLAIVGDNSVVSNYGQMAQSCTCAYACSKSKTVGFLLGAKQMLQIHASVDPQSEWTVEEPGARPIPSRPNKMKA